MTHDKSICEFCQAVATLHGAMAMIESIVEFDVPLYDEAVMVAYEAVEEAADVLRCRDADRESDDEHEREGVG